MLRTFILTMLLIAGCSQGNSGDPPPPPVPGAVPPSAAPVVSSDPNVYLLGPNQQIQPDGTAQIDSPEYATAYYEAIDPLNEKNTLTKWKAANLFDTGTGTQVDVVFGDVHDLGYGRKMTARQNPDGTLAFVVDNYVVTAVVNYTFSTLNLEAAVVQDPEWFIGTNAIEFSPGPGGGLPYVKFYSFAADGQRRNAGIIDGRGIKTIPTACISCHGGRQDPLTPPDASGNPLFPRVSNSSTPERGAPQAWLQPFIVDTFAFSTMTGFTRAEQEADLKIINEWILCSFPIAGAPMGPEDMCRRPARVSEWQGTAAARIKAAYGGDGLPSPTFTDSLVPVGWSSVGQSALYSEVLDYCGSCHLLRGTGLQSDIDFDSFAKFQGYADRIKDHVFDRGDMPFARIIYDALQSNTSGLNLLANFLENEGFTVRDANGALLIPGRPIADPGPDRVVRQGSNTLSGSGSLFSAEYEWSLISGPNGAIPTTDATLTNADSIAPIFDATADGNYVLELVTANGDVQSEPTQLTIVVDNTLTLAPTAIRFSDIKTVFTSAGCVDCHFDPGFANFETPIFYTDIDRNGDVVIDATDNAWFYAEVRGRIDINNIKESPLLAKPTGQHHAGGERPGFDISAAPGQAARDNYDLFLNWILNGAPI